MTKSADAFRTISEVAGDLDLPQHVLRFWETRFPQIKPLKRAGGRRFYRPADIMLLTRIRQLLYDQGYTIKGVQRLLKEQGVKAVQHPPIPDLPEDDWPGAPLPEAGAAPVQPASPPPLAENPRVIAGGLDDREALEAALDLVAECERILALARGTVPHRDERPAPVPEDARPSHAVRTEQTAE